MGAEASEATTTKTTEAAPAAAAATPAQTTEQKPADGKATEEAAAPAAAAQPDPASAKRAEEEKVRFAQRQNEFFKQKRDLDVERARIKQEADSLSASKKKLAEYEALAAKAKENPLAPLEAFGVDLDTLVEYVQAGRKIPPEKKQAQAFAELNAKLEEESKARKALEEQLTVREQRAREAAIQTEIRTTSSDRKKYPAIALFGLSTQVKEAMDYVYEHGEPTYGYRPGTALAVDRACEIVENLYRPRLLKAAKEFLASVEPASAETETQEAKPQPAKATSGKSTTTIDNSRATAPATVPDTKGLTAEESKKLMAEMLRQKRLEKEKSARR